MIDWVITTKGKVVRRDKAKPTDEIPYEIYGHPNTFNTREDAYIGRDGIADKFPAAFLPSGDVEIHSQKETAILPEKNFATSKKAKFTQDEFRNLTRAAVIERYKIFWNEWDKLRPKEKCDLYVKMLSYAFATAPAEKPLDAAAIDKIEKKKEQDISDIISQGIPPDFEE